MYPIDLVKTRLQNQNTSVGEKLYKNMYVFSYQLHEYSIQCSSGFRLDCFKKTYAAEGYFGMYRGKYFDY